MINFPKNGNVNAFFRKRNNKTRAIGHNNFERYDHYIGKVKMGDNEYYVRFTVQVEKKGKKRKKYAPLRQEANSLAESEISIYENSEPNNLGKTTLRADSVPNFVDTNNKHRPWNWPTLTGQSPMYQ